MVAVPVKERITGAIILVAVLVLLVPELLTGPSRSVRMAQPATSADGAQMRSYTIDLADDAAHGPAAPPVTETPGANAADPPATAGDGVAAQSEQSAGEPANSAEPESSPTVAPESEPPAVASTAEPTPDARPGSPKPAEVPRAETPKPAPTARAEAPKPAPTARAETPKPAPREPASATRTESPPARAGSADSKPTSGWAVQVGSFASRDNAERLAQKLKGKGFAATITQSPKGRHLWRVRVGPEPDRAAATALGARLRAAGQSGAVVPYP